MDWFWGLVWGETKKKIVWFKSTHEDQFCIVLINNFVAQHVRAKGFLTTKKPTMSLIGGIHT